MERETKKTAIRTWEKAVLAAQDRVAWKEIREAAAKFSTRRMDK